MYICNHTFVQVTMHHTPTSFAPLPFVLKYYCLYCYYITIFITITSIGIITTLIIIIIATIIIIIIIIIVIIIMNLINVTIVVIIIIILILLLIIIIIIIIIIVIIIIIIIIITIIIAIFVRTSAPAWLLEISILPHTLPGRCWLTSCSSHRFAASGVSDLNAIRPQKGFADCGRFPKVVL